LLLLEAWRRSGLAAVAASATMRGLRLVVVLGCLMEPNGVLRSLRGVKEATRNMDAPSPPTAASEVFADFYRREHAASLRLAWLLTGSRVGAEDVVQDAMTSVFRTYDRIQFPSAYLRRAVVNTAKSRQRDERRHWERVPRQERSGADKRSDAELLELIAELPYRQRVVIIARYWGGWSEQEIAYALGCRPGTVKSLASRALDRLRAEVEQ
jgi:RNA polymerase sigma factor (sigma-70 family)